MTKKVALVTGAMGGLGTAICQALAKDGMTVLANCLPGFPEKDPWLAKQKELGFDFIAAEGDVSDYDSCAAMVAKIEADVGPIDVLVNNAGITRDKFFPKMEKGQWDAVINTNLNSLYNVTHHISPKMAERGWGRIINTASAHSLVASPFKSAYISAKHGIAGLTKTVALELATFKITCNCISPGYVWTPLVERQIPDTMKARNMTKEQVINDVLLDAQPTKQFVTVEQVAALAVYLCGDDASQITGANLSMDGGWTAA